MTSLAQTCHSMRQRQGIFISISDNLATSEHPAIEALLICASVSAPLNALFFFNSLGKCCNYYRYTANVLPTPSS